MKTGKQIIEEYSNQDSTNMSDFKSLEEMIDDATSEMLDPIIKQVLELKKQIQKFVEHKNIIDKL